MSNIIKVKNKGGLKLRTGNEHNLANEDNFEPDDTLQKQFQMHYDKGYQDSQKATKLELEKEYTNKLVEYSDEFKKILSALEDNLKNYEQVFDKVVIEVAINIAEKILKNNIEKNSIIQDSLKESVRRILGANEVMIKLNPKDFQVISNDGRGGFLEESFSKIKFEQDDRIEIGGCLVETEIGNVDARISTQIAEIKKQLESNFNNDIL